MLSGWRWLLKDVVNNKSKLWYNDFQKWNYFYFKKFLLSETGKICTVLAKCQKKSFNLNCLLFCWGIKTFIKLYYSYIHFNNMVLRVNSQILQYIYLEFPLFFSKMKFRFMSNLPEHEVSCTFLPLCIFYPSSWTQLSIFHVIAGLCIKIRWEW